MIVFAETTVLPVACKWQQGEINKSPTPAIQLVSCISVCSASEHIIVHYSMSC